MNIFCLLPILSIFFADVGTSSASHEFDLPSDPIQAACASGMIPFGPKYEDSKVYFLVWTMDAKEDEKLFNLVANSEVSLNESKLDGELPTYVFFHGYGDNGMKEWILQSKNNILSTNASNVISICYEEVVAKKSSDMDYVPAVCNAFKVAEYAAKVLNWLSEKLGIKSSDIHLIGHSLGAHIAGITAQYMLGLTVGKVGRVTGLDPAGPGFSSLFGSSNFRIDKSQAEFVDIIHTNGCEIPYLCFGIKEKVGHADFYPNGGVFQPGCPKISNCHHLRATEIFVESIKPLEDKFQSWPCNSWEEFESGKCSKECDQGCPIMGSQLALGTRGVFCLSTNAESPFAKGDVQM